MNVLIAMDKLRGSLPAWAAGQAVADGIRRAWPAAACRVLPMADGGEGTAQAVLAAVGGEWVSRTVHDPLGRPHVAGYARLDQGLALIEMATASGLALLRAEERTPLRTSSRGTGELVAAAIAAGARRIVLAVGGSATVDGGAGMLIGLGACLRDRDGCPVDGSGGSLGRIWEVDLSAAQERLQGVEVTVASDVTHPLLGPAGAAAVFGPQKGATPAQVSELEAGLAHWAERLVQAGGPPDLGTRPGTGAAGGVLAALLAVTREPLWVVSGLEWVAQAVGLDEAIRGADLVVTGEGRLDAQTPGGKVVAGVGRHARRLGRPAVALVGSIDSSWQRQAEQLRADCGLLAEASIVPEPMTLADASARTAELLTAAGERMARWLGAGAQLRRNCAWGCLGHRDTDDDGGSTAARADA